MSNDQKAMIILTFLILLTGVVTLVVMIVK